MNKKIEEEFITFEALIQELNDLVTPFRWTFDLISNQVAKPESLETDPQYTLNKGELRNILEKYEDREDDIDDEPQMSPVQEIAVSKQPRVHPDFAY